MPLGAIPVQRGCGTRQRGGIYSECGLAEDGQPLEAFIFDPPLPLTGMDLAPQGVAWMEHEGTWHVLDWVGSNHYPNVADFLEEVRRFGMSRRLPRNAPLERLGPGSKHFLVHARAFIRRPDLYRPTMPEGLYPCPHYPEAVEGHPEGGEVMCAGLWWEDVDGTEPLNEKARLGTRLMPSFSYLASPRPDGVLPMYEPGIVAAFPITRLAVVRDPDNADDTVAALDSASRCHLPVDLEEE